MVAWWWLIVAAMAGGSMGMLVAALLVGAQDLDRVVGGRPEPD